jgi:hypothetical protein
MNKDEISPNYEKVPKKYLRTNMRNGFIKPNFPARLPSTTPSSSKTSANPGQSTPSVSVEFPTTICDTNFDKFVTLSVRPALTNGLTDL